MSKLIMRIPKKENIVCTGSEDPVAFYYHPLTRVFYIRRLGMVMSLLYGKKYSKALDIGYGCGILFPELSMVAEKLYGIDIHPFTKEVSAMLEKEHLQAELLTGDIYDLPYKDENFDCVMAVSVLEHIDDLERAFKETARVMSHGGDAVFGFPIRNKLTDILFYSVGFDYSKHHVSSHNSIITSAAKIFRIDKILKFPSFLPSFLPFNIGLYAAMKCVKE